MRRDARRTKPRGSSITICVPHTATGSRTMHVLPMPRKMRMASLVCGGADDTFVLAMVTPFSQYTLQGPLTIETPTLQRRWRAQSWGFKMRINHGQLARKNPCPATLTTEAGEEQWKRKAEVSLSFGPHGTFKSWLVRRRRYDAKIWYTKGSFVRSLRSRKKNSCKISMNS
jgi:hypothetical protein